MQIIFNVVPVTPIGGNGIVHTTKEFKAGTKKVAPIVASLGAVDYAAEKTSRKQSFAWLAQ